jgi:hypothetical protein
MASQVFPVSIEATYVSQFDAPEYRGLDATEYEVEVVLARELPLHWRCVPVQSEVERLARL